MTWIHDSLDRLLFYTPIEASALKGQLIWNLPTLGNQVTWSIALPRYYMRHSFCAVMLVLYGLLFVHGIIGTDNDTAVQVYNVCTVVLTVMFIFLSVDYYDNFGQYWTQQTIHDKWEKAIKELTETPTLHNDEESILSGKQINEHAKTYIKHMHELKFISDTKHKAYEDQLKLGKMGAAMDVIEQEQDVSKGPFVLCPVNVLSTLYHKTQNKLFANHAKAVAAMDAKRKAINAAKQEQDGRDLKYVRDVLGADAAPNAPK